MFALVRHLLPEHWAPHADLRDSRRFEVLYALDPENGLGLQQQWGAGLSADLRDVYTCETL